jgi:hypothetical protein
MPERSVHVQKVYGISNSYIDSYVSRHDVDDSFLDGLRSNRHIIVYGSSKQGKTSLIREHILDDEKIVIECSPRTQVLDIYKSILRQLNIEILETVTVEKGGEKGGKVGLKAKLKIPFFSEGEATAEASGKMTKNRIAEYKTIEFDLSLAQDITEIIKLREYKGRIVIENFHYLNMEVQLDLSFDLRTFQDNNILFIILGIWRERNRLTQFNGDLTDRLIEVPVEPWQKTDFTRVIKEGEPFLNVCFDNISELIIEKANGSIGVLQELCKYCCLKAGVKETNDGDTIYLEKNHLENAILVKIGDYSGRHIRCLEDFISDDDTKLNLHYYFLMAILNIDVEVLEKGVQKSIIEQKIKTINADDKNIRSTDFNRFFNHLVESQLKKNISPPIFEFDKGTQSIKIIDSTFTFFIKHKNRQDLLNCFANPDE